MEKKSETKIMKITHSVVVIYPSGGLLNTVSIQKSKKETFIGQRAGKTPKHIHTFRNF